MSMTRWTHRRTMSRSSRSRRQSACAPARPWPWLSARPAGGGLGLGGEEVDVDAALEDLDSDSDQDSDCGAPTLGQLQRLVHKGAGPVKLSPQSLDVAESYDMFGEYAGGTWGKVKANGKRNAREQWNGLCEKCDQPAVSGAGGRELFACDYCNVVYCGDCLGDDDTDLGMMLTQGETWCCPDCWRPASAKLNRKLAKQRLQRLGQKGSE